MVQSDGSKSTIEFFFDPISPYAWLASTQLGRISNATGLPLVARPILFAGLLNAHGHTGPAEIPAKRNYLFRDVLRRAQAYNLAVQCPPNHPFNPLLALRICTAIVEDSRRLELSCAIMNAAWGEGLDITDPQVVGRVVEACELDKEWAIGMAADKRIKQALIDNTAQAVEQGIFGVPNFRVAQQNFWGEDRIDDLLRFCSGQTIDEEKLARILAREPAASRQ